MINYLHHEDIDMLLEDPWYQMTYARSFAVRNSEIDTFTYFIEYFKSHSLYEKYGILVAG